MSRGPRYDYVYYDEAFRWSTDEWARPMIHAERNAEGVYVITEVTRKAGSWRTNPQTPTVSPEPFKAATAKFFQNPQS